MELEHYQSIALYGFIAAMIFGAIASRTQFCTMGAVSDWVNMGSKTRFKVWMLAMGLAMICSQSLDLSGTVTLRESIYLMPNFTWLGHLIGGFLFGVGMTLGSGCGQRTLVRLGGGNLKSLVVVMVLAISAYMTLRGLLALLRLEINEPTVIDLAERGYAGQGMHDFLSQWIGISPTMAAIIVTAIIGGGSVIYALKDREVRSSFDNLLAGIGIGLLITAAWYITGVIGFDDFDPIPVEGMTFVAPVGNMLTYLMTFTGSSINFGIAVVFGLIFGAFVYSIATGTFRVESFSNKSDLINHLSGGALMGFGGVLGLGCTVGQGITGMSTLALGALITLLSIIVGCAFTLKTQYYLYDEKGWGHALKSAIRDLLRGRMATL